MVRTRSSSPLTEDEVSLDGMAVNAKIPISDSSKTVKVVVAPGNSISTPVLRLPNPRNGTPTLYVINEDACFEIVQAGLSHRSWFYGEDVIEDGSIRMYSPVNPLFLALPYFIRSKDKFIELDEIITDGEYSAIEILKANKQLLRNLEKISDQKDICDTTVYRYNAEKTFAWLETRLERIKAAVVQETIHKAITEDEEVLNRYCFGILQDYIPEELVEDAKKYLGIKEPVIIEEKVEMIYKRKSEMEVLQEKPAAKKIKESVVKKQLAQASKGTKSINSFFTKKK